MTDADHVPHDLSGRRLTVRRVVALAAALVAVSPARLRLSASPICGRSSSSRCSSARCSSSSSAASWSPSGSATSSSRTTASAQPPTRRRAPGAARDWPSSSSPACSWAACSAQPPAAGAARGLVADRPPHRPLQLRHLRRLPAQRGHQGRPLRRRAHPDHARPRPLQALQRQPRPRGRQRRCCGAWAPRCAPPCATPTWRRATAARSSPC